MEHLDIVDENGEPTGKTVERGFAHSNGIPHRTSHVWLIRKNARRQTEILLQKRSDVKDCFPGCYDISSAGHIPAGSDFLDSAVRELKEELGITADKSELIYIGRRKDGFSKEFYGKEFIDVQISNVYLFKCELSKSEMSLQKEEVSDVLWLPLETALFKVKNNEFPHCIAAEELEMIIKYLSEHDIL